jgi:hypothetical protein
MMPLTFVLLWMGMIWCRRLGCFLVGKPKTPEGSLDYVLETAVLCQESLRYAIELMPRDLKRQ